MASASRILFVLFLLLFLVPEGMAWGKDTPADMEKAAVASAEEFLRLVDQGAYGEAWAKTADVFKRQVDEATLSANLQNTRPLFGKVVSRKVRSARYLTSAPGAPDGEYVLILYQTVFENKKAAMETVTPVLEADGKWRVAGYFIR